MNRKLPIVLLLLAAACGRDEITCPTGSYESGGVCLSLDGGTEVAPVPTDDGSCESQAAVTLDACERTCESDRVPCASSASQANLACGEDCYGLEYDCNVDCLSAGGGADCEDICAALGDLCYADCDDLYQDDLGACDDEQDECEDECGDDYLLDLAGC